jgi:hypothetical protein
MDVASPYHAVGDPMSCAYSELDHRREYILAEFRCAVVKAKLALCDLEATMIALQFNIVTPEQAAAMFWDSEAVHFLGLELRARL